MFEVHVDTVDLVTMPTDIKDEIAKFAKEFPTTTLYGRGGGGRGNKELKVGAPGNAACKKLRALLPVGADTKKAMAQSAQDMFDGAAIWCHSKDCRNVGPEFAFLGSCKYQMFGSRSVLLTDFHYMVEHVKNTKPESAVWCLQSACCAFASMASQQALDSFVASCPEHVMTTVVAPGEMLCVPPGWVVADKTLNGADAGGLRFVWVPNVGEVQNAFRRLASWAVPEPDAVQANSAGSLLKKVFVAMKEQIPKEKAVITKATGTGSSGPAAAALRNVKAEVAEPGVALGITEPPAKMPKMV